MSSSVRAAATLVLRLIVIAACCAGGWWSWKIARADSLYREDTPASIRAALGLVPDRSQYYMRLSQLDGGRARQYLQTALTLNRYNAQALIELALRDEAQGANAQAEKLLLEAFTIDHTYISRWSLANFYFRRDNLPAFWHWARLAAQMPADDIGALFQLCWHAVPDAHLIARNVLTDQPVTIRQFLGFLMARGDIHAAASVAPDLVRYGQSDVDRPLLLNLINRTVEAGDASSAVSIWRLLADHGWVVADDTRPNNSSFLRDPLPVAFDWTLASFDGLHSWPGPSGLEVEFTGRQPENCLVTYQTVPLAPGSWELRSTYRTSGIAADTGLYWDIQDPASNTVLARSSDLSSESPATVAVPFQTTPDQPLVRFRLVYTRALGTTRISGMLVLVSTNLLAKSAR